MVTWSLETQPRRSQRILKPGTPSQNIKLYSTTCFTTGSKGGHSVFGSPAPQIPKNPKPSRHLVFLNSAAQIPEHPKAVHPTPICYHEMNEPCSDAGWGGVFNLWETSPAKLPPETLKLSTSTVTHALCQG